jgi:prepilin peptidase CpaA
MESAFGIVADIVLYVTIAICAVTDILHGKIYNKITYPAIVLGLLLAIPGGLIMFKSSLIGLIVGFLLFFFVFLVGGFGGGDVKLMAAIGAIKGYPFIMYASFYSALVGGIIALGMMIWKGKFLKSMRNIFQVLFSYPLSLIFPGVKPINLNPENSERMPFGFAICFGTIWAVVEFQLGVSVFDFIYGGNLLP